MDKYAGASRQWDSIPCEKETSFPAFPEKARRNLKCMSLTGKVAYRMIPTATWHLEDKEQRLLRAGCGGWWTDGAQRIFRAGNVLGVILPWWTHVTTHSAKPTERAAPGVSLHASVGSEWPRRVSVGSSVVTNEPKRRLHRTGARK